MNPQSQPLEAQILLSETTWIRSLARGIVADSATADDLAQDALLASLRGARPRADVPPRAWMSGVLRNLAWKRGRSEARRGSRERRAARREDLPATSDLVARAELQRMVTDAVLTLEEPYRSTVLLRYFEGHSSAEIARAQGQVEATVRWRVQRGIELLRTELEKRGGQEWLASCAFLAGLLPHAPQAAGALAKGVVVGGVSFLPAAGLTTAALVSLGMGAAWFAAEQPERAELATVELVRPAVEAPVVVDAQPRAIDVPAPLEESPNAFQRVALGPPTPTATPDGNANGELPISGTNVSRRAGKWVQASDSSTTEFSGVGVFMVRVISTDEFSDLDANLCFEGGEIKVVARGVCEALPPEFLGDISLEGDAVEDARHVILSAGTPGDLHMTLDPEALKHFMVMKGGNVNVTVRAQSTTVKKP